MERVIDDFVTQYRIKSRGEWSTLLKNKTWGTAGMHIIIAVLTVWWTLGLGNITYAIYQYMTADEVQIKVEGVPSESITPSSSPAEPARESATATDGSGDTVESRVE